MDTVSTILALLEKSIKTQEKLLNFIENEEINDMSFKNLIQYFEQIEIGKNKDELKSLLILISAISNDHCRTKDFFTKFEQIINYFQKDIKTFFSNLEIFKLFKANKRLLYFLFTNKIIIPDQSIFEIIIKEKYIDQNYIQYFFPEFENFIDRTDTYKYQAIFSKFPDKQIKINEFDRKSGENNEYLCQIIKNDSIKEFVTYVNKENIDLSDTFDSIYETNSLLSNRKPSLIEYAAFYGSTKIFNFIKLHNYDLKNKIIDPSIWLFAVHSNNAKMIYLLEHLFIEFPDFKSLITELIKCNHINITRYIFSKLPKIEEIDCTAMFLKYRNFLALNYYLFSITNMNVFEQKSNLLFYFYKYRYYQIFYNISKNTNLNINAHIIISFEIIF